VFISYARKDGTETAHHLRDTLTAAGFEVWLDTDRIGGGASWSKVIEDVLRNCDVLVAALTEGSYVSEMCRSEQLSFLEERKRIIPVLATPSARRPVYLRTLQYRHGCGSAAPCKRVGAGASISANKVILGIRPRVTCPEWTLFPFRTTSIVEVRQSEVEAGRFRYRGLEAPLGVNVPVACPRK